MYNNHQLFMVSFLAETQKNKNMDHSRSSKQIIHLILLYSFLFVLDFVLADPAYQLCSNNTSNNSFQNNLNKFFSSLPSNASVSKYYNSTYGNGTDQVYVRYMCLNYVTNEICQDCISGASRAVMNLCPNRTEAVVPEEVCHLSNSKITFFGPLNVTDHIVQDKILVNVSDPIKFQSAFNSSGNMYALVQCTLDSSPDDCNKCLEAAIKEVTNGCNYLHYELTASNHANESSVSANNQGKRGGGGSKIWMIVFLTVASVVLVSILQLLATILYCKEMRRKGRDDNNDQLHSNGNPEDTDFQNHYFEGFNELKAHESHIDLATINSATNNLSDSNLLGQGGFGPVYKGVLSDGKEVAVKRLSSFSEQGTREFANEVLLILKLQHKNLVRLLGFCVDNLEKLLVYEFMPNGSVDVVLFDTNKRAQLDWSRRINIINGIARGILYLHEDSRLRIIHRDLKASNVLLDSDMNPKISDFGMARICAGAESEANTAMIVGTYGYMAPEYAMEGLYSIKSDVFSFGVLLLEIITGRRNAGFNHSNNASTLVAYAWHLWNEGKALELMDPLLTDGRADEFLRFIHIGLLCVQEDAYDRPTMSSVVVMLKGETVTLSQPQQPAFSLGRFADFRQTLNRSGSVNGLSISNIAPR